jgi:uncharacterized protein YaaN involved in tellurite resistance
MSDLEDNTDKELLRLARCAETTMQADDTSLLNTNLELDLFDNLWKEICDRIDTYEEQRVQIVKEEKNLQEELQQLVEEERLIKLNLEGISLYKAPHPKRRKVTLPSL